MLVPSVDGTPRALRFFGKRANQRVDLFAVRAEVVVRTLVNGDAFARFTRSPLIWRVRPTVPPTTFSPQRSHQMIEKAHDDYLAELIDQDDEDDGLRELPVRDRHRPDAGRPHPGRPARPAALAEAVRPDHQALPAWLPADGGRAPPLEQDADAGRPAAVVVPHAGGVDPDRSRGRGGSLPFARCTHRCSVEQVLE
jgi:hypothetical protein